jgi:release factor glutamine methyltransferase
VTLATATRTIAASREVLAEMFRQAGIDSAEADARLLVAHALGIDRAELLANGERALNPEQTKIIDALAARRLKREPIARIYGRKEFWSLSLQVTPAVLVPRPETETVVEAALDAAVRDALQMEKLRILDIGTGSGALLLALLSELPNAVGTGTDISTAALAVARANAERNDLSGRCGFIACDIAVGLKGPFDLIVSNPPYIDASPTQDENAGHKSATPFGPNLTPMGRSPPPFVPSAPSEIPAKSGRILPFSRPGPPPSRQPHHPLRWAV